MINNRKLIAILAIVFFASAMILSVGAVSSAKVLNKDLELKFSKKTSKGVYVVVKNVGKKTMPATKISVYSYRKFKYENKKYTVKSLKKGKSVKILIPAKVMNAFNSKKGGQIDPSTGYIHLGYISLYLYKDDNRLNNNLDILYGSKKTPYIVKKAAYMPL
ncbi:hypothetical protein MBCUT_17610 [Methanobrevibacter cuticularis]|uniref:CARDB domain-containing protein n=1 Tax=Methanobrevibacter cuticularis TaxID=47311 RepID=A0A166CZW3_9EURY|nr:hypothetical protein [Methanobrevibacter cuticularis]KZX15051.1 hypothetical protein MBCUT_17610 [Methanobrevibacter cuticularis]